MYIVIGQHGYSATGQVAPFTSYPSKLVLGAPNYQSSLPTFRTKTLFVVEFSSQVEI
jgi:hypothetical protein